MYENQLKESYKQLPKVLIFEHPPINKNGIGKTLYAFFYNWSKERLGQVYSVDLPIDENLCQYFYISEVGVSTNNTVESREKRENYRNSKFFHILSNFSHSDIGVLVRNLKYKQMIAKNRGINKWIDEFNPDCIFYGIGEIINENDYVLKLAKSRGIPLLIYISDDYMTKWNKKNKYKKYARNLYESYVEALNYSSLIVVISEKMRELYKRQFPNCKYLVASNSSICKRNLPISYKHSNDIIRFSYTGNLGFGRWKMLEKFAEAIEIFNESNKHDTKLELAIYSQERPDDEILSAITSQYCFYKGNVVGNELDDARINSDVLLLVESFEKQYESVLSTALSTKVPEYLSYGKLILAWAPKYAWSFDYLEQNGAAYCISEETIEDKLTSFVDQYEENQLLKIVENGNNLFDRKHEFMENASNFAHAIYSAVMES